MNLFIDEKFKRVVKIVRKFTTGYCLDQSRVSDKNIWEIWRVGKTQVMITAKRDEAMDETIVQVWAPVTDANNWDSLICEVAEIQARV